VAFLLFWAFGQAKLKVATIAPNVARIFLWLDKKRPQNISTGFSVGRAM
jgi:hypothetical protein